MKALTQWIQWVVTGKQVWVVARRDGEVIERRQESWWHARSRQRSWQDMGYVAVIELRAER